MRILGLVGLVLVSLIVGFVVQEQTPVNEMPATSNTGATPSGSDATVLTRQVQQGIQRSLNAATRTSRDVPNEP